MYRLISLLMFVVSASWSLSAEKAAAEPQYFATVYITGDADDGILGSHFFATFFAEEDDEVISSFDISLMPEHPLEHGWRRGTLLRAARGVVPAKNMSVRDTLALAKSEGKKIRAMEAFKIPLAQFRLNRAIARGIESGDVQYRFVDLAGRGRAMNCRTAVAGPDFRGGLNVDSIEPLKKHMQSRL